MSTSRHALPTVTAGQSGAETTHNEALQRLDALTHLHVLDRDLATPPVGPANGDCYLVAAAPTGAWAGKAGYIAIYADGWLFQQVRRGMLLSVEDESQIFWRKPNDTWVALT